MLRRLSAPPFDVLTPHLPTHTVAAVELRREIEQIIADVAARGDAALVEQAIRVEGVTLTPAEWEVPRDRWAAAFERLPPLLPGALAEATRRVKDHHDRYRDEGTATPCSTGPSSGCGSRPSSGWDCTCQRAPRRSPRA